jgi:non-ribosomal peptide synthetase component F
VGAGLSPFIVFIGALTHAVRGVNHEPRLGFMTIFANREAAGAHDTVAYLANRMPLFVDGGADGLMSALIAARLGVLRALAMQRFPFMEVVRRLAPDLFGRSPRRPTMMVNFLDPLTAQMRRPEQVGGTAWTWVDLEPVSPSLGLNLFIDPGDPALSIETRFDPAAYTGERVRALVDDVIAALLDMISDELGSIVASSDRRPQPNQHPPSS